MATRIALFVAALALGTLVEYLLHRFFLHSRLRHGVIRRHKMHHKTYVRYSIASEFLGFFPPAIPFLWVGFVYSTAAGIAFIAGEVAFVRAVAARTCAGRRRAWRTRQLVRVSDAGIRGRPFGNRGRACRRSRRPILASPGDKGQNGFRLSLFGADPAADPARLLREASGRRLNRFATDDSLLLLKGTGATPHEGGNRMPVGGPEYRIVRNWIAAGAKLDDREPRGSRGSRSNRRSKRPSSANGIVSRCRPRSRTAAPRT